MTDARITAMINFVHEGSRVADVGADHGYLSIELAASGRAKFVTATEKNPQPLQAARKNISAAGLDNIIDTRHGDGLQVLSAGEVDTICIAGMGGALIAKILDESPDVLQSARQLILQPMNASEKVRLWLTQNGWVVDDEDLAEVAGFVYEIISAVKISEFVPKKFKRESSPLLKKFLLQQAQKLRRVLDAMNQSPVARTSEKFFATCDELNALQQEIDGLL